MQISKDLARQAEKSLPPEHAKWSMILKSFDSCQSLPGMYTKLRSFIFGVKPSVVLPSSVENVAHPGASEQRPSQARAQQPPVPSHQSLPPQPPVTGGLPPPVLIDLSEDQGGGAQLTSRMIDAHNGEAAVTSPATSAGAIDHVRLVRRKRR